MRAVLDAVDWLDADRVPGSELVALRDALVASGFHEQGVKRALGLGHLGRLRTASYPAFDQVRLGADPRSDLLRAFLLGIPVVRSRLEHAVGAAHIHTALAARLLVEEEGDRLVGVVALHPVGRRLYATDPRAAPPELEGHPGRVMYLGDVSYDLALLAAALTRPGDRVVDLGTGCGVGAIEAAAAGGQVLGTDPNPRAIAFARFNACLNGLDARCSFAEGAGWAPAEGRWDLALASPPFVPAPVDSIGFRDGGPDGDRILRQLLAGMEAHLSPRGVGAIRTGLVHKLRPWNQTLMDALSPARDLAAIALISPPAPTLTWLEALLGDDPAALAAWLAHCEGRGILGVGEGLLLVGHSAGPLACSALPVTTVKLPHLGRRAVARLLQWARDPTHLPDRSVRLDFEAGEVALDSGSAALPGARVSPALAVALELAQDEELTPEGLCRVVGELGYALDEDAAEELRLVLSELWARGLAS